MTGHDHEPHQLGLIGRIVAGIAAAVVGHRWLTIALWVVVVAALFGGAAAVGPSLQDEVEVGGSDSAAAAALLAAEDEGDDEAPVTSRVVIAGHDMTDPETAAIVADVADALAEASGSAVENPLADPRRATATGRLAPDGQAVELQVIGDPKEEGRDWQRDVDAALDAARDAGLDVAVGAPLGTQLDKAGTVNSEALGVAVALVVLLVALGSAFAALVPVATGIIAVAGGVGIVWFASHGVAIPEIAITLAVMVGLGVGIDYALFLLSRLRAALRDGTEVDDAVVATAATAGEAAAVAGVTVAACATGLAIAGVDFVSWLGYATAIVVLVAVAATLTLTPAVLATIGRRALPRRERVGGARAPRAGIWARIAPGLTAHPIIGAVASTLLLLAIAVPAAGLQLGQSSAGNALPGSHQRTAYDLTAEHWGAGANAPLLLVSESGDAESWAALASTIAELPGVAEVAPAVDREGVTTMQVTPTTGPSDPATAALVDELRTVTIPDSGVDAHVGGAVTTRIDLSDRIAQRLPWLIGAIIAASMVLVAVAFRSVLLPIKAALCNLLSIAAAFGVLVVVFQEGNGVALFGLDGPVPLDPYVPMMLFAVLFGLSMDYEVFLLTAVREHHARGTAPRESVARGLAETGGVITAAAIIMIAVFLSFTLHTNPTIKVFGLGMAVAVFLDATIIRLWLVPSVLALLGSAAWWWPFGRSASSAP